MPTWLVSPRRPSTRRRSAARAEALIARRVDSAMAGGYQSARRRLVGLLARRGYAADIATSVVDAALAAYREEAEEF